MDPATPLYMKALQLALAGATGTLARWGVYAGCDWAKGKWDFSLPLATLTVNVVGSFLFGLIWAACDRGQLSMHTRWLLLGGFMGAFTTFSSFAFDTGDLIAKQQYLGAAANVMANNVLGIGAFFVGLWAATLLPHSSAS